MTFLVTVQVLFIISICFLLFGVAGIMITNKQDDRWLVAVTLGIIGFFALGVVWWVVEPKASCCKCPAEQEAKP